MGLFQPFPNKLAAKDGKGILGVNIGCRVNRTMMDIGPLTDSSSESLIRPTHQPSYHPARRRRHAPLCTFPLYMVILLLSLLTSKTHATLINFDNCLPSSIRNSTPLHLQFIPLHFYAHFNATEPSHNLNVTIYGNVSGLARDVTYPPPDDPQWGNTSQTVGKIVAVPTNYRNTTILAGFDVLTYTPFSNTFDFCKSLVGTDVACPLGPVFDKNG